MKDIMIERMDRIREGLIGFFEGDPEAHVSDNKDAMSRLARFRNWLWANDLSWYNPDLAAYRDRLTEILPGKYTLSRSSTHKTTICAQAPARRFI